MPTAVRIRGETPTPTRLRPQRARARALCACGEVRRGEWFYSWQHAHSGGGLGLGRDGPQSEIPTAALIAEVSGLEIETRDAGAERDQLVCSVPRHADRALRGARPPHVAIAIEQRDPRVRELRDQRAVGRGRAHRRGRKQNVEVRSAAPLEHLAVVDELDPIALAQRRATRVDLVCPHLLEKKNSGGFGGGGGGRGGGG